MPKVLIVGDVHGNFDSLRTLIQYYRELIGIEYCIVCGDYGIWTDFKKDQIPLSYNTNYGIPVYFCDGNHENHAELDKYERGEIHQLTDWLHFCAFGSVLELNGTNILFCGGADSIDKQLRTPYVSWWPTEVISLEDLDYLPNCSIDTVISHTCPSEIADVIMQSHLQTIPGKSLDPSCSYLDRVLERYKPNEWVFGHWHISFNWALNGTEFFGLNMLPQRLIKRSLDALLKQNVIGFAALLHV